MTELSADYKALAAYRPHPQGALRHRRAPVRRPRRRDQHHAAHPAGHGRRGDPPRPQPLGRRDRQGGAAGGRAGHRDQLVPGRPRRVLQVHGRPAEGARRRATSASSAAAAASSCASEIAELQGYGVERIYSPEDGQRMGLAGMIGEMMMRCDVDLAAAAPTSLAAIRGPDEQALARARPADHRARERRRGRRAARRAARGARRRRRRSSASPAPAAPASRASRTS